LELLIKQFDAIILIHIAVIHIYRRLFHVIWLIDVDCIDFWFEYSRRFCR
jgi:hypothetical protein